MEEGSPESSRWIKVSHLSAGTGNIGCNVQHSREVHQRLRGNAAAGQLSRSFQFTLVQDARLVIDLTSALDTYTYVLHGKGMVLVENDDVLPGRNPNSRIDRDFKAGTYTVEATTYGTGIPGEFILNIRYLGN